MARKKTALVPAPGYDLAGYFTESQHNEIQCMVGGIIPNFDSFEPQPRKRWVAIGEMALGKAHRIEEGAYGQDDEDEGVDLEEWADELRGIASEIFEFFQSGDGKI